MREFTMNFKQVMKNRARDLRKDSTDSEQHLWYWLRSRRLNGYKFHRQYIMGSYITDFVCLEKKIIIELDGSQHAENISYDENRKAYLNERGFHVLRYWNDEVLDRMEVVLEDILAHLESCV